MVARDESDTSTPSPATSRRRRARKGEGDRLREEILTTATKMLLEQGTEDAISIRAIADAIGITPPSIYMHFANKDELFAAVCRDPSAELDRTMEEAAVDAAGPLDELRRRGVAYVRFGLEHPKQYRTLFMDRQPQSSTPELVAQWSALRHMVEAVQRCIDARVLPGPDAFVTTLGLWAMVHGITSLMVAMPEFPWPPVDVITGELFAAHAKDLLR